MNEIFGVSSQPSPMQIAPPPTPPPPPPPDEDEDQEELDRLARQRQALEARRSGAASLRIDNPGMNTGGSQGGLMITR